MQAGVDAAATAEMSSVDGQKRELASIHLTSALLNTLFFIFSGANGVSTDAAGSVQVPQVRSHSPAAAVGGEEVPAVSYSSSEDEHFFDACDVSPKYVAQHRSSVVVVVFVFVTLSVRQAPYRSTHELGAARDIGSPTCIQGFYCSADCLLIPQTCT